MQLSEFDYELPAELIAQTPLENRDASRLLVLNRKEQSWADSEFTSLAPYLQPDDVLVLNNTRVFPARLVGRRDPSGGRVEVLLVRQLEPMLWEALVRPAHRLKAGARVVFAEGKLNAEIITALEGGRRVLQFECDDDLDAMLDEFGEVPLPPYIKRPEGSTQKDRERYQTVYANSRGAVAAPTAGLHFTEGMLDRVRDRGVQIVEITLHVGYGTFEPVRVDEIEKHRVAPETFAISSQAATAINDARDCGRRIISVGTTTTRALESAVNTRGEVEPGIGLAAITITPGYSFRITDALITNFHLPQSSLLLLVCAFAGRELVLDGYRHAVESGYRFYSYGDCMLIL
ncbi:MAG: S-adenosylmethionine:tRNA ribosyltransferase-isomerase [Acidobacteria bacterium]|nr:S-adenosylmethionine:tRNA ribosyltransferase-isomerase [Acidobacteriota bacterium]